MITNILFLIETGGPGGAEKMLLNLVTHIDRSRFYPFVCLTKKGWLYEKLINYKIKTYIIKTKAKFDFLWSIRLAKLVLEKNINLIHTHLPDANFYGALTSLITKCPQIATEHGDIHHMQRRLVFIFKYFFTGIVAKKVIAVSNFTAQRLKTIINSKKISVIYNGINLDIFKIHLDKKTIRKKLGVPEDAIIIVCIANFYPVKGHYILLKAFSIIKDKIPNAYVICAGKGELKNELVSKVQSLGLKDRFLILGFREDIPELLIASDIFVLPSFSEAFPMSLLEAMGAGLPVIATNVGGVPELVEDGKSGFIVNPGAAEELVEKILFLVKNKTLIKKMGSYGKNIILNSFDVKRMVLNYQNIYKEIIQKNYA